MRETCDIRYCYTKPKWQVEIAGFFKQFMCDKHRDLLEKAINPKFLMGIEEIN